MGAAAVSSAACRCSMSRTDILERIRLHESLRPFAFTSATSSPPSVQIRPARGSSRDSNPHFGPRMDSGRYEGPRLYGRALSVHKSPFIEGRPLHPPRGPVQRPTPQYRRRPGLLPLPPLPLAYSRLPAGLPPTCAGTALPLALGFRYNPHCV